MVFSKHWFSVLFISIVIWKHVYLIKLIIKSFIYLLAEATRVWVEIYYMTPSNFTRAHEPPTKKKHHWSPKIFNSGYQVFFLLCIHFCHQLCWQCQWLKICWLKMSHLTKTKHNCLCIVCIVCLTVMYNCVHIL